MIIIIIEMEKDKTFTLDSYLKGITSEPHTYSIWLEKRKKSKLKNIDLKNAELNSHTVIKDSQLVSKQVNRHIKNKGYILDKIKFMDVGCGLGFISNEIAKTISYENVYCCDPCPSTKKFIDLEFPNLNFIHCDIETIPQKFNNYFDIVYLREVYPFTRTNNFELHKKLLEKLFEIIKPKGAIVLEQIKGEKNIFNNLSKLNYTYDIKILIPNRLLKNKFFTIFNKPSYTLTKILLGFLYKLIKRAIPRYYITFKKV